MRGLVAWMAAGCLAAPAVAGQRTQRFDYKPSHHVQEIEFALDGVRIRQVVFRSGPRAGGASKRPSAECSVRVDNDGQTAVAVGVAVVVFDAEGNVVAAGSGGTRVGWLWPGERDTSKILFPFVYRNFDKAKTFWITMELERRPAKEDPAPKPVPQGAGAKPGTSRPAYPVISTYARPPIERPPRLPSTRHAPSQ